MWTILKIAAAAGTVYGGITTWVFCSQNGLVFSPRSELADTPDGNGLTFEDVWLENALGTEIHGWWIPCEETERVLLFCHGNGGNVSHLMDSYRIFHDLGLSVLVFDYSGYGLSGGKPSERATRADALAAWNWLADTRRTEPRDIIVFGRSLGGGVAARLAADLAEQGEEPGGLILESTFTSLTDMGAMRFPWLPVRWLIRHRYDSMRALSGVRTPTLFLHSPDDELVPYAMGRELYESYEGSKLFWGLTGDHNYGFLTSPGYADGFRRFLAGLPGHCR